tara:strand:+ start:414 stop:1088 length:675 start_codon:yes stop_codon:yes gene_type:complete
MYALVHNYQLILGPIKYNYRLINGEIEELELDYRVSPRDYDNVPITIDVETKTYLIPAIENIPEYDPRFQFVGNFEWTIIEENDIPVRVEFSYSVSDKTLEQVKEEYKSLVAPIRWEKENKILTLTVNNTEVEVSTDREERTQFVSKLVSCSNLSNSIHNYKFRNGVWKEIGCTEIEYILEQIDHEVQEAFDWEIAKYVEIDACITKEDVYDVILREPVTPPEP